MALLVVLLVWQRLCCSKWFVERMLTGYLAINQKYALIETLQTYARPLLSACDHCMLHTV